MKPQRRLKAEVLALLCIALLWAVDLKTNCVPRAAAGALRQMVKVAPNWENGYDALGWVYLSCRNHEKANEAFGRSVVIADKKAVESDPNDAVARCALASHYHYNGERGIERAIEQYKAAVRIDPNYFGAWASLGDAYTDIGSHQQAVEAYHKAAEIDPEDSYVRRRLMEACNIAIRLRPDDPNNYVVLGQACYDGNEYPQAIENLQKALRIDSKCEEAYTGLSDCYRATGRYEESVDLWKQAKHDDPKWRWPYIQLALDYNDLGRYDEAIAEWKRVIELEPEVAGLNVLLAGVYLKAARYEEAVAACKQALRLKPNMPTAHYYLAKAYLQIGKKDLALQEYQVLKGLDAKRAEQLFKLIGENHSVTIKSGA